MPHKRKSRKSKKSKKSKNKQKKNSSYLSSFGPFENHLLLKMGQIQKHETFRSNLNDKKIKIKSSELSNNGNVFTLKVVYEEEEGNITSRDLRIIPTIPARILKLLREDYNYNVLENYTSIPTKTFYFKFEKPLPA